MKLRNPLQGWKMPFQRETLREDGIAGLVLGVESVWRRYQLLS